MKRIIRKRSVVRVIAIAVAAMLAATSVPMRAYAEDPAPVENPDSPTDPDDPEAPTNPQDPTDPEAPTDPDDPDAPADPDDNPFARDHG